ncbi:MAG: DUF2232 domain-containing protein [Deltaproteobacteria bacterium]|nr:DUF2232 domain-containing protein [Deltaproteobacteria bacterium]
MDATTSVLAMVVVMAAAVTFPSSIVFLKTRRGRPFAYGLVVLLGGLGYALGGAPTAAWMLALFAVSGLALGFGLVRFKRIESVFLMAWAATMVAVAVNTAVIASGLGVTPGDVRDFLEAGARTHREMLVALGAVTEEQAASMSGMPDAWLRMLFAMLPALYAQLAAIIVWLNLMSVARWSPVGVFPSVEIDLTRWSAPEPLVFGVLAPGIVLAIAPDWRWQVLAGNVLVLFAQPFFFQGFAILAHTLGRMRVGPAGRMLTYVLALGFLGAMLVPLMVLLALADIWLDFRRLRRPPPAVREEPDDEGDDT